MSATATAPLSGVAAELLRLIHSVTGRPTLRLEETAEGARTDGKTIYLPGPDIAKADGDPDLTRVLAGLALHESGHCLWSDWGLLGRFQQGRKFPKLAAHVLNFLEDPRVETLMANLHPLSHPYLVACSRHFVPAAGHDRYVSPKPPMPGQVIEPASKLLKAWMLKFYFGLTPKGLGRLKHYYQLGVSHLPPAYWYACDKEETARRADALYRILELVAVSEEGAPEMNGSNWGTGDEDPVGDGKVSAGAKEAPAGSNRGAKPTAGSGKGKPKPGGGTGSAGKPEDPAGDDDSSGAKDEGRSEPGEEEDEGEDPAPPKGNIHSDESGAGGSIAMNIRRLETRPQDSNDRLESVCKKPNNGSAHTKGDYPVVLHKPAPKPEEYRQLVATLNPLILKLEQAMEQTLRFDEDLEEGRLQGHINRKALPYVFARDDIFSARLTNRTAGEVGVQILVDASGSMSGIMHSVRSASIVFHEAMRKLGIRHGIAAHTTGNQNVLLLDYVRPDSPRSHSARLATMQAMSGNRDGTAVRTVANYLKTQPEPFKLLLVLNDGLPSDYHGGENGLADTKAAVKEASSFAQVVGIWLGSATPERQFAQIYPNHVACEDIKDLPAAMTRQLERICGLGGR